MWFFFAENRDGKRELELRAGAGFRVFYGVGMRDSQGEQSGIRDFNSVLCDLIN